MANPGKGTSSKARGGLRKVRFAGKGKGRCGGLRVIYYYLDEHQRFYLLTLFSKNEMTDLTASQGGNS
ncbi:hypothetical protein [Endozoicomonas sp. 8E]|uniref:hypothetical protein n=1 Tax=Endozoicomonas sp. 8E TaxID=3035692 RepID=UPI002939003C|nr:hypothetical protein [Endozoicomonas sp. 8E]WOG27505.1 hypothetical protein P6910_23625 [Endozoicomonas sp. 8E]